MNPLKRLSEQGQSVWLDYIRRSLVTGGDLRRLINEDGLTGLTSNPSIFEKAIAGSDDYASSIQKLGADSGMDEKDLYERLAIEDIRLATDELLEVYQRTGGGDGFVSLEVSPHLAADTRGTVREARRLWKAIDRQNLMIKVPATPEGILAFEELIAEAINVNVTLLFAREVYDRVAEAYLRGLDRLVENGGDPAGVASVASFFLSRIDTAIDAIAAERLAGSPSEGERKLFRNVLGKVGVANAKLAYQRYREIYSGKPWKELERHGARTQRLLWASTSSKNPKYGDLLYLEQLIGPDTVTTVPPATLAAFREHGRVEPTLERNLEQANDILTSLAQLDIPFQRITGRLLQDGLRLFTISFDKLVGAVGDARGAAHSTTPLRRSTRCLPDDLEEMVINQLEDWHRNGKARRLWSRDASLWTGADEGNWLDWLGITEDQATQQDRFSEISREGKEAGFSHILLMGMGGSSLCPEVLARTFRSPTGYPELLVLDSTDPAQVKSFEKRLDPGKTLFVVSSKSGNTLEPNIFFQYFFERVRERVGPEKAGRHFIAITDPGSRLQELAESHRFRRVFLGVPGIGGRYSALSDFGMVPAALAGFEVGELLDRAEAMVEACAGCVPAKENPGVVLGVVLGVLGREGRDKVSVVASPPIAAIGAWLEQLLAESTGKQGRGLIPVDGEIPGPPEVYGTDRLFVYLRLNSSADPEQDEAVQRLQEAGQPVVKIALNDPADVAGEFFRWEFATAVAGSILGVHPFDQPDVEASKIATRKLTEAYETSGGFPTEIPLAEADGIRLFTDEQNGASLKKAAGGSASLPDLLGAHLARIRPGDYFALLAYLERSPAHDEPLQTIRHRVRDSRRVATCLGYGPRFLHSTGQAYKGGPNTGLFLQITCDDSLDLKIPGRNYTFGAVKEAQARGDFQVLAERRRRVVRIHLGGEVRAGLDRLRQWFEMILK